MRDDQSILHIYSTIYTPHALFFSHLFFSYVPQGSGSIDEKNIKAQIPNVAARSRLKNHKIVGHGWPCTTSIAQYVQHCPKNLAQIFVR
jgi:hypothetical protein